MKSKRKFQIVLLEEHEKVNFYSIQFDGEEFSEFEKFLRDNTTAYPKDIGTIMYRISKIGENGAQERYFRYGGKRKDRVAELPSNFDKSVLRLYCLRINEKIVILGTGGKKTTRTYNENEFLEKCVEMLQRVDEFLKEKVKNKEIVIIDKTIN